jgi:CRISPR/Cas system-associated exonuclease Cas4 (RecB family)
MLYVSVSSIKDFLECKKRYWYRTHRKEASVLNQYVIRGSAVHEAIEAADNIEDAREYIRNYYSFRAPLFADVDGDGLTSAVDKMLVNYYEKINPTLGDYTSDLIEYKFEIPWSENITLVGKIDRITFAQPTPALFDWKTGTSNPNYFVTQDIQFYVYWWAFQQIWEDQMEPDVFYGHLYSGKLHKVDIIPELWYNIKALIDDAINELGWRGKDYDEYPRFPGYQCDSCFFKGICWNDLEKKE